MAKQLVTLHMYAKTGEWDKPGSTEVWTHDFRGNAVCMKGRVWIGQQDVDLDLPEIDTRQAQIDALEAEVAAERTESQVRVNLLLERISKLRAIGHEVSE